MSEHAPSPTTTDPAPPNPGRFRLRRLLPPLALLLVGLAIIGFVVLPAAQRRAERQVASAKLKNIGVCLVNYASANGGALPPADANLLAVLAPFGLTTAWAADREGRMNWFHYVPGRDASSPASAVILYEDPASTRGAGGCIVAANGLLTFLPEPQFTATIDALTLPDGTPWTPHKPGWTPPAK